jgi:lipopolysaccharide export system protein LptA
VQINKYYDQFVTYLKGNVVFYYGNTQFKADQAELFESEKTVVLRGNVRVKEDTLSFYSDLTYYYRNTEYLKAIGRVKLREDHSDKSYRELHCNQLDYYRNNGDMICNDNVKVFDQKDNINATCGYASFNNKTGYGYMLRNPLVWQKSKDDSLRITAEKIEYYKNLQKIIASFNVITKSKDMNSKSDFLVYYGKEEKAVYLGKPEIFSDFGDARAENITVLFKDNIIQKAELQDSCFIKFSEEKFQPKNNTVSCGNVEVFWANEKLSKFIAKDNVETYIFKDQKKRQLPMNNSSSSSELIMTFDENQKLDKIDLKNKVNGKYAFKRRK